MTPAPPLSPPDSAGARSAGRVEAGAGGVRRARQFEVEMEGGEWRDDAGEELDGYRSLSFSMSTRLY